MKGRRQGVGIASAQGCRIISACNKRNNRIRRARWIRRKLRLGSSGRFGLVGAQEAAAHRELARRRPGRQRRGSGGAEILRQTSAVVPAFPSFPTFVRTPHLAFKRAITLLPPARPRGSPRGGALRVYCSDSDLPQIQSEAEI